MVVRNSTASNNGGGIFVDNGANLNLLNSRVEDNTAGAIGGGIYFGPTAQSSFIQNSRITGNSATAGGGIWNHIELPYGQLTVQDSTIAGNTVTYTGGGLDNNTVALIQRSAIINNIAPIGGGVHNMPTPGSSMTIEDSTIAGNTANGFPGQGAGIYNNAALTLNNVTLANNIANNGATAAVAQVAACSAPVAPTTPSRWHARSLRTTRRQLGRTAIWQ